MAVANPPEDTDRREPKRELVPNALTGKTIADAEVGKGIVECVDAEDFFRKLGL